jgi:hypothetical protein
VVGLCEHGNEPLGSIRKKDIFDKLFQIISCTMEYISK